MRKNFKASKFLFILFCLILTTIIMPTNVSAKIDEQDNLKVRFEVEQVKGSADEVKGTIRVSNIGIRPIDDINIKTILPENVTTKDDSSLEQNVGNLNAGESKTYEVYGNITDLNQSNTEGEYSIDDKEKSPELGDNSIVLKLLIVLLITIGLLFLLRKEKIKKKLAIFTLIAIALPLFAIDFSVNADEQKFQDISIEENILIGNNTYIFKTIVSYKLSENEVIPSGDVLTRGEWISKLNEATGLNAVLEIDNNELMYVFDDIEDSKYKDDIINAIIYSVVNTDTEQFRPNEPATREFAAVTAVRALGFVNNKNIECADSDQITYKKEVQTAVEMDLINLSENHFNPVRGLSKSEADYILEGVQVIIKSTEISPGYDSIIDFRDGVIELNEDIKYIVEGQTVILELNDVTKTLKKDDIFVLSDKTPYKVTSVIIEDINIILETTEPEIEETIDYIDVQGYATLDTSEFIPAEGVTVIKKDGHENQVKEDDVKIELMNYNPEVQKLTHIDREGDLGSTSLDLKIGKEDSFIKGEIGIEIPEILYKVDMNLSLFSSPDINDVFLKFPVDINSTFKLKVDKSRDPKSKDPEELLEIGKIPVGGVPGVTLYLQIMLAYSVEGQFRITFGWEIAEVGMQIYNNQPRRICNFGEGFKTKDIVAEGSAKAGPRIAGLLELCKTWDLLDVDLFGGLQADATGKLKKNSNSLGSNKLIACIDIDAFVFLELGILREGLIGDWLEIELTFDILNKNNSPLRLPNLHFENLKRVPVCTFSTGTVNGTVSNTDYAAERIEGAKIDIFSIKTSKKVAETTSDSNGKYSVELLIGEYKFVISKEGYLSSEVIEEVSKDKVTNVRSRLEKEQDIVDEDDKDDPADENDKDDPADENDKDDPTDEKLLRKGNNEKDNETSEFRFAKVGDDTATIIEYLGISDEAVIPQVDAKGRQVVSISGDYYDEDGNPIPYDETDITGYSYRGAFESKGISSITANMDGDLLIEDNAFTYAFLGKESANIIVSGKNIDMQPKAFLLANGLGQEGCVLTKAINVSIFGENLNVDGFSSAFPNFYEHSVGRQDISVKLNSTNDLSIGSHGFSNAFFNGDISSVDQNFDISLKGNMVTINDSAFSSLAANYSHGSKEKRLNITQEINFLISSDTDVLVDENAFSSAFKSGGEYVNVDQHGQIEINGLSVNANNNSFRDLFASYSRTGVKMDMDIDFVINASDDLTLGEDSFSHAFSNYGDDDLNQSVNMTLESNNMELNRNAIGSTFSIRNKNNSNQIIDLNVDVENDLKIRNYCFHDAFAMYGEGAKRIQTVNADFNAGNIYVSREDSDFFRGAFMGAFASYSDEVDIEQNIDLKLNSDNILLIGEGTFNYAFTQYGDNSTTKQNINMELYGEDVNIGEYGFRSAFEELAYGGVYDQVANLVISGGNSIVIDENAFYYAFANCGNELNINQIANMSLESDNVIIGEKGFYETFVNRGDNTKGKQTVDFSVNGVNSLIIDDYVFYYTFVNYGHMSEMDKDLNMSLDTSNLRLSGDVFRGFFTDFAGSIAPNQKMNLFINSSNNIPSIDKMFSESFAYYESDQDIPRVNPVIRVKYNGNIIIELNGYQNVD